MMANCKKCHGPCLGGHAKRKVRRPNPLWDFECRHSESLKCRVIVHAAIMPQMFDDKDAKRLIRWLTQAVAWLDYQQLTKKEK